MPTLRTCDACMAHMSPYLPRRQKDGKMLCPACYLKPRGGYVSASVHDPDGPYEPCNAEECKGFPEGKHTNLEHIADEYGNLRGDVGRAVDQAFGGHDDSPGWLLDHQHQGPSKFSVRDQNTCPHDGGWNLHGQCKQCGHIPPTEADEPCDNEWCVEHEPEHSKGEHIDPSHLDPFHPDHQSAEKSVNDAIGDHPDAWLINHQGEGPSKWSKKTAAPYTCDTCNKPGGMNTLFPNGKTHCICPDCWKNSGMSTDTGWRADQDPFCEKGNPAYRKTLGPFTPDLNRLRSLNMKYAPTARLIHKSGIQVVAHDSGDGETIYHCPFCGSGQVLARSDGTVECEFCHTAFTVQVQPEMSAFPQTINGIPVDVPGMPGEIGSEAPMNPADVDPGAETDAPGAGGAPPAPGDGPPDQTNEEDDVQADNEEKEDKPPFMSSLRTEAGAELCLSDFIAHVAIKHSAIARRDATLEKIRNSRHQ